MVFENIEALKKKLTDKYVVVDKGRPELRRFEGQLGQIKTVNMNGHALVEFDGFANIGWYDISPEFLVDAPPPSPDAPVAAKKAAKPAAKKAAPPAKSKPGGMSVADMLSAARGEKGESAAPEKAAAAPKKAGGAMSVAEMLAAARGEKGDGASVATKAKTPAPAEKSPTAKAAATTAPATKADPSKMSVADMLAAARAEKSGAAVSAVPAEAEPAPDPEPEETAAVPAEAEPEEEQAAAAPKGDLPTETSEICAYCRKVDGN